MNKKKGLLGIAFGAFLCYILPLVSAQWGWGGGGWGGYGSIDLRQGSYQVIQWVQDFAAPFFEILIGDYSSSEFFFAKSLLLILIFVIVFAILKKSGFLGLERKSGIIFTIAAVVSILAIRFLPDNSLINGILLPYSTLGIAITTFLPLLIYFFFIHESVPGHAGRRMGWALYAIIFIALWNSQDVNLSDTSNWIYITGIGLVILFFIFDSKFHEYFALGDFRRAKKETNNAQEVKLLSQWDEAKKVYDAHPNNKAAKARLETLERTIRDLYSGYGAGI